MKVKPSHTRMAIACILAGMISTQIPTSSNLAFAQGGYVGEARNNSNLINLSDSQVKGTVGAIAAFGVIIGLIRHGEPIWPDRDDEAKKTKENKPSESSGSTEVRGLVK